MGTLVLAGATSGSATLTPVDAVTAVITLPSATATLATLGANTFTGTQTLTGGGSGGLILGYGGVSTYGAIWSNQVSPSTSNYALFVRANTTQINVPTGGAIYLGINTNTTLQVNATGADVTGTLSVTGLISPSQTVGIVGTTTNNSAQAGSIGEFISSVVSGVSSGYTTGTTVNVTSISLTAGDWDVWGLVFFNPTASSTMVSIRNSVTTTSATLGAEDASCQMNGPVGDPAVATTVLTPTVRFLLSATTTVYLVGATSFSSAGTYGANGTIRARRRR